MSAARSRVLPTPDKSSLIHRQQTADTPTTMASALSFDPIFLYIALGLSGIVAFSRLLLSWAN
jgi:hypothetical protein